MPGVGSLSKPSDKPCTLLGRALRDSVHSTESPHNWNITERVLDDLMASFPQGQIFDLSDLPARETSPSSDLYNNLCHGLAKCFPNANSVLFSPIWDWNKSRWLAGTLVWTSDVFRALGAEELHYFKAFGDSIISEVARVDWSATQKSKSAFMSSVSHELRSPLHGILASAELLGTTSLPPEQQHLVDMVESCGLTLLDTLNHLLVPTTTLRCNKFPSWI
jgi:signal transduction histidine kinase